MFSSSDVFSISGYDDVDFRAGKQEFVLQVNPEKFDVGLGDKKLPTSYLADGSVDYDAPSREMLKWNFTFLIDNTGVLSSLPTGCTSAGTSIAPAIVALRAVTKTERNSSHDEPFVEAIWSDLNIRGRATNISTRYTFFDNNGNPLRAKATIEISKINEENPNLQSPDISRMPTIKDGDNLVQFCEEFYSDKNFYLKIAELNNLSSFRSLEKGKRIEFPPIKK